MHLLKIKKFLYIIFFFTYTPKSMYPLIELFSISCELFVQILVVQIHINLFWHRIYTQKTFDKRQNTNTRRFNRPKKRSKAISNDPSGYFQYYRHAIYQSLITQISTLSPFYQSIYTLQMNCSHANLYLLFSKFKCEINVAGW